MVVTSIWRKQKVILFLQDGDSFAVLKLPDEIARKVGQALLDYTAPEPERAARIVWGEGEVEFMANLSKERALHLANE